MALPEVFSNSKPPMGIPIGTLGKRILSTNLDQKQTENNWKCYFHFDFSGILSQILIKRTLNSSLFQSPAPEEKDNDPCQIWEPYRRMRPGNAIKRNI